MPSNKTTSAEKAETLTPIFDRFTHSKQKPEIRLISQSDLKAVKQMISDGLLEFASNEGERISTQHYLDNSMSKEVEAHVDPRKNTQFNRKMWVAVISGEIVGCIGLQPTARQALDSKQSATLHIMSIKKSHRRQGIGGLLLQTLEDYSAKQGIGTIRVTTQRNLSCGKPFYEKHGFQFDKKQSWENLELLKYKKAITPTPKAKLGNHGL